MVARGAVGRMPRVQIGRRGETDGGVSVSAPASRQRKIVVARPPNEGVKPRERGGGLGGWRMSYPKTRAVARFCPRLPESYHAAA